jgi:hypothetical protein
MTDQIELDLKEPEQESNELVIWDWKTIGTHDNFTVLGMSQDNKIYYWKDKVWNLL